MIQLLKAHWQVACVVVVLLAVAVWALLHQPLPAPPLSPAAAHAVQDGVNHNQRQVGNDTAAAKAPAASAATSYAAGTAYAQVGQVLHQQSKPHAKNTPTLGSDTAATRLQRLLSAY